MRKTEANDDGGPKLLNKVEQLVQMAGITHTPRTASQLDGPKVACQESAQTNGQIELTCQTDYMLCSWLASGLLSAWQAKRTD